MHASNLFGDILLRRLLKRALIGLAVVVGLLIVLAIVIPTDSSDKNDQAASGGTIITRSIAPTPTYEPKKAGQTVTTPAPYGQPIVHNNLEISVLKVVRPWRGDTLWSPKAGKEWVAVSVSIRNLGDKDKTETYNPLYFRMTGANGIIYDDFFTPDTENSLRSGEFFGGAEITGDVLQQVSLNEKNLVLIWTRPFEGSRYLSLE